ncbi:MAG: helix-turn-helix domain-containing protein [Chloroflexia bacterium]|nr:helix-turn-helix domain-containing protein [Chloroflexia bacterium]
MDITLGNLLVLEPAIVAAGNSDVVPNGTRGCASRTVSWAVTARTTAPHLPPLRGGEVLIIPIRVTREVGQELPALLREAALRDVSAVIFAADDPRAGELHPKSTEIPVLQWNGELTADTETVINRLLTECRGNLYRLGTELERQLADASASHSGIETLAQVVSHSSGLPLTVVDPLGRRLISPAETANDADAPVNDRGGVDPFVTRALPSGAEVKLGPLWPVQFVLARFLIDRIAVAAIGALQRDDAARPRGSRRGEATARLLTANTGSARDQRAAALALGLDPDAVFFVVLSREAGESDLTRALSPLGTLHPAGGTNGQRTTLVAAQGRPPAESLSSRVVEVKRRWEKDHNPDGPSLALSAPAFGVARIAAAAKEAEFVASLQTQAQFARRAASFESLEDVGAMRLLYQLRDSNELRQFIAEALGPLETRDHRGTLRATLRAFLESGGSQVAASHKLGIHRNTLAYRLRRIGELVGRDVGDPGSWLTLHVAIRASEMLDLAANDG